MIQRSMTPFEEGHLAGYRDSKKPNPYRKGIAALWGARVVEWAQQWDAGYEAGQAEGRADVVAKHRENCR